MTSHVFSSLVDDGGITISSQASRRLRDAILRGELRPGARINLSRLSHELGISLSPLREALARLIAEDLVEFEDNRGYRVSALSEANLKELTLLRSHIEPFALEQAVKEADEDWDSLIIKAEHRLAWSQQRDGLGATGLDQWICSLELHRALLSGCRVPQLKNFCQKLQNHQLRYLHAIGLQSQPPLENLSATVQAALRRDASAASVGFRRHLAAYGEALEAAYSVPARTLLGTADSFTV